MSYAIEWEGDPPATMVDLGGGMVVPLAELADSAQEVQRGAAQAVEQARQGQSHRVVYDESWCPTQQHRARGGEAGGDLDAHLPHRA